MLIYNWHSIIYKSFIILNDSDVNWPPGSSYYATRKPLTRVSDHLGTSYHATLKPSTRVSDFSGRSTVSVRGPLKHRRRDENILSK
jgi:hypothetical protein